MYTIKEAAARAGVTVPVLRAWERRYGVVEPRRATSGYRLYTDEEIARVSALRQLVATGWSPSAAAASLAGLPDTGVRALIAESQAAAPSEAHAEGSPDAASFVQGFVSAAASLDAARIEDLLDEIGAIGSFERVAGSYLLPALVSLGAAWENGEVDVAGEHAASYAVLRRLAGAFAAAGRDIPTAHPVLVGLPPGSRHELGALAFSVAARRSGLPVLYVGSDLPIENWIGAAARTGAAAVVIGVITDADREPAASVVAALRAANPNLLVAIGGRAAAGPPNPPDILRLPDGLSAAVDALRAGLIRSGRL